MTVESFVVDLTLGLPTERQRLAVREVARYLSCGEDHVYHLVQDGALRGVCENPLRIDRQSAINFRAGRQLTPLATRAERLAIASKRAGRSVGSGRPHKARLQGVAAREAA